MRRSILEFIPNQPFSFHDVTEAALADSCGCQEGYALKYQPGDPMLIQFRQRWGDYDTKPNIACQPNFNELLINDLLTNGSFTGGASGWTISDVQVVPLNDALDVNIGSVGSPTVVSQPLANTLGNQYLVTLEIRDYVMGSVRPTIGATAGSNTNLNGIKQQIITGDGVNGFTLDFSVDSIFTLDNISVYDLTNSCWVMDGIWIGKGYFNPSGGFTKIPNTGALTMYNTGTGLSAFPFGLLFNGMYAFKVKIKNRTQGKFTIKFGITEYTFEENGEFSRFLNVEAPGFVEYKFDIDFDGTIEFLYCFPLYSGFSSDGFVIHLTDMEGNFMGDVTPYINYQFDYIVVLASMDAINSGLNPYGCYKLKVSDAFENPEFENLLPQGDFNDDSLWVITGAGATINDTVTAPPSRIGRLFVSGTTTIKTNVTLIDGDLYYFWFNRIVNTAAYTVQIKYGGVVLTTYAISGGDPSNTPHAFLVSAPANDELEITISGLTANTLFEEAKIYRDSTNFTTFNFESNAISYKEVHECTKIIQAYSIGFHHGFSFNTVFDVTYNDYIPNIFSLWQRLSILSFNPSYPTGQNISIESDGDDELTNSTRKKYKVVHFDNVDEIVHDCISTQRICQYFFIYPGVGVGSEYIPQYSPQYRYVSKREDYVADNDKNGRRCLTQSRFEVALKNNNIFYSRDI